VTKRKVSVALLACLMVVMAILMAVPMGSSAASGIQSTQWSGAAFMGVDNFYGGANVVAYTAGSTAKLTALVKNEGAVDATIREAKIRFDWGDVFAATNAPTQLKAGETGVFTFEFTVPDVAVATNTAMHSYDVIVGYQNQGTNYVRNLAAWDDGVFSAGTTYQLDHQNLIPGSVKVWFEDAAAHTITEQTTGWVTDDRIGTITFGAAIPVGATVRTDYQYGEAVTGTVDGVNKVFYTTQKPLADGSVKVYLRNDTTQKFDPAATGWTVDLETGKITLASAPSTVQSVIVGYEYWSRWPTSTGTNFVVYSADQAGAADSAQTYNSMNTNYPAYLFTPGTVAAKAREEASVTAAKAAADYTAGDFANAKTGYETAVTSLQAAIEADATLNTPVETAVMGLLSGADDVVNAYAGKLKGEASMDKNVGVFYIMLGVAVILAGLATIIWAFAQFVVARGPSHHEHT
jgi:hypothetical protein